ncbi:MAG: SAP domain-containing protein [Bacilli bacterium]|nr:SAP domain-containing protein [Bacilli bacterium]
MISISERPDLDNNIDSKIFKAYYYLKEELIDFCRKNNLQTTGSKLELIERIANFLDTGKRTYKTHAIRKTKIVDNITLNTIIEENFICSEKHRAFYKEQIGNSFSFNVAFQKWLKSNAGKTFNINQILSICTGRKYASTKDIGNILSYLLPNENIDVLDKMKYCKEEVLKKYPKMRNLDDRGVSVDNVFDWIEQQQELYGDQFTLTPINVVQLELEKQEFVYNKNSSKVL